MIRLVPRLKGLYGRLTLLVLLTFLPALGLIMYQAQDQRNDVQRQAEAQALSLARLVGQAQADTIQGSEALLITLAHAFMTAAQTQPTIPPEACAALLGGVPLAESPYANVGLAVLNGDIVCNAIPSPTVENVSDRSWFQGALQTRDFFVGSFQIGRIMGLSTINTGFPVMDGSGQVVGVVFAALDLAWMSELAAGADLPSGTTVEVVDRSGTVLMRYPNPQEWVGKTFADAPVFQFALSRTEPGTTRATGLDGVDRLLGVAPLFPDQAGSSPMVLVEIPASIAFADVNDSLRRNLIGLAVVLGVVVAFGVRVGGYLLMRMVKSLVRATEQVASGELNVRSGVPYSAGEFGQLARSFDTMAGTLAQREQSLRESNQELEAALREVRQTQRQLVHQERTQALQQLANGIAHDSNNLLMPILGFSETLLRKPDLWEDREKTTQYLTWIHTAGQDLTAIVRRLRLFSQREAVSGVVTRVDLNQLVNDAVALSGPKLESHAKEHGAEVTVNTGLGEIPEILGETTELREALVNLISNAVDAMPTGGTVTLSTRWVEGCVALAVRDTGVGMTEEVRQRCLEPFFSTKGGNGSGMGLAVVDGVVQRHGGTLTIESELGKGTTVTLRLPVTQPPKEEER